METMARPASRSLPRKENCKLRPLDSGFYSLGRCRNLSWSGSLEANDLIKSAFKRVTLYGDDVAYFSEVELSDVELFLHFFVFWFSPATIVGELAGVPFPDQHVGGCVFAPKATQGAKCTGEFFGRRWEE